MNISKHFKAEEFVPREVFYKFSLNSTWFINLRLVETAEKIRLLVNKPIIINNWDTGGNFDQRGFRTNSASFYSQHCHYNAIDFNVVGMTPPEVYPILIANYKQLGFTAIENIEATPTWNHIDLRWTLDDKLLIVNP